MENRRKRIAYIKLAILIFIIVGLPVILFFTCRDTLFNKEWLANLPEFIMQYKGYAAAVLTGIQILQVIICIIPGQPIQLAASYLFGVLKGYLISISGAFIGAFIAFYIARALGKDSLEAIFGEEKVNDYHRKLNSGKGLTAVLLIYLIPGVPKDLVAYVAGISDMRLRPFLIVSTIGRSPGMLGSLLTGYFISSRNYAAIGVLAVVTAVILIICFVKRKQLVAMLDDLEKKDEQNHQ
ncbi:MAG: TVP38/TMEM64 family protein [Mogibacterium sp.]|nr:TVP38/TMEM64 family protein [Mogibacterium sp.]